MFGFLIACLWALLLAACGGGGGSPGKNSSGVDPTQQPESKVTSLVITTSADTMNAGDGKVNVTVLAKDANNNAVANALVKLSVRQR